MIAGAKKYAKDHPTQVALTTNACKTNDDTPCQIAEIQDAVTKGAKAIVIAPMGVGVTAALKKAQKAGVRIVFVDNTIPGIVPTAVAATDNIKGGLAAGAYIKTQLKSGDTIGLLEAVRGVPNLDQRIDGVKKALVTVDPTPFFTRYGNNTWAAVKTYQAAQVDYASAPVIRKYTGVLAAADVYTASTAFVILESIRLDLGIGSQVHP